MADAPTSHGSFDGRPDPAAGAPAARPAQRVVLHQAQRPTPETLVRTFAARGVEVRIEHEPILALAELGRRLVEHRQRVAQHATFHSRGETHSPHPHLPLILVIVEPREFDDVDELIAAIARAMPLVSISSFEGGAKPGLRLLQRGRTQATPPARATDAEPGAHGEPPARSHGPRPALRLTPDDRQTPAAHRAAPAPSPWSAELDDDDDDDGDEPSDAADAGREEQPESLISQAELAMLLGDDYAFGDDPPATERSP